MKKTLWLIVVLFAVVALGGMAEEAEAQMHDPHGVVATGYHGVPAQPVPGNGTHRHYANGYYGNNYRHYSRVPMKYGTGPTASQLRSYTYRPYRPYRPHCTHGHAPVHYGGYPQAYYPQGYGHPGGYIHISGGYVGPYGYVQGGVVIR